MDLATGQLDPEFAVTWDLTTDNTFSIRVRSRANPDIVGKVRYQSRCIANTSFNRPAPGLPTGFCPQMLTCGANERMAITVSIFTREFDTNPSQIITIPSTVRNKTSQMTSAALCVLNATSAPPANISLKTAFERFTSNQRYAWKIENFELWDDIDSPGIEFVN
jgi:hypothetical protein